MSTPAVTYKMGGITVTRPLRFMPQRVVITPIAAELLKSTGIDPVELVRRHQAGDWGDVCASDEAINDRGLSKGSMLMSTFRLVDIKQLAEMPMSQCSQLLTDLIITDAAMNKRKPLQRHITTVLTREDY
jgi:hypothetical protein